MRIFTDKLETEVYFDINQQLMTGTVGKCNFSSYMVVMATRRSEDTMQHYQGFHLIWFSYIFIM